MTNGSRPRRVVQFQDTPPGNGLVWGFTTVLYDDGTMYTQVWKPESPWLLVELPDGAAR